MRLAWLVVLAGVLAAVALPAVAQRGPEPPPPAPLHPGLKPPGAPPEAQQPHVPQRGGELDCRGCHERQHQAVVHMYLGMGGRNAAVIPSHMFQVRVQCVACHITPTPGAGVAGFGTRTFRPSEQACVGCHGERYRGMLQRWTDTGKRIQDILAPKLKAARAAVQAADAKHPRRAHAEKLVDDAEFNAGLARVGKGVHNVFYAAELTRLANGWADQALTALGQPVVKVDDRLVRGGYCGVLCHEQAGVKVPETVTFAKQKVPHARHVSEFGATCTVCHSAEVHKAVTAKPATCTACHHGAENERCESCHRQQSAFYRGQVKGAPAAVEPNVMVNAVSCTGCHDWSKPHSRQAVTDKCVGCHDKAYESFADEWTGGLERTAAGAAEAVKRAEAALSRDRKSGRKSPEAEALLKQAREALLLVHRAKGVHNPPAAEALLEGAKQKAAAALAKVGKQ